MRMNLLLLGVIGALCSGGAVAEPLKDPRDRDEDVSRTQLRASVDVNARGHFVYVYDVDAPLDNTGEISLLTLNLSCAQRPEPLGFDAEDYGVQSRGSRSEYGKHVPVVVHAARGQATVFGVGATNRAFWGLAAPPGTARRDLTLISPYPPGPREYALIPSIRYGEEKWDYSGIEEDDPSIPWIDDWTVTGMTTGPACPGEEYPPGEDPQPSQFDGSLFPGQSAELNKLLTYSAPLRDQLHVDAGTRELLMTVHYGPDLDPRTFRVTPQQRLRGLFNPKPGTSETVRIPLVPGKNRIELQAQTAFTPPGQAPSASGGTPAPTPAGREPDHLDRDVFVIRVPVEDEPGARGRGRPE